MAKSLRNLTYYYAGTWYSFKFISTLYICKYVKFFKRKKLHTGHHQLDISAKNWTLKSTNLFIVWMSTKIDTKSHFFRDWFHPIASIGQRCRRVAEKDDGHNYRKRNEKQGREDCNELFHPNDLRVVCSFL